MYNTALSLYFIHPFEQFTTFFSEYQQDFSLMVTLKGTDFCYYFYILWSHFSKMILITEEVITASLKVISAITKEILAANKLVSATEKNI